MGGGFGGCTINIVTEDKYEQLIKTANEKFTAKFGVSPKFYPVKISDEARRLA